MNNQYENLLAEVLANGASKTDRTGTGTLSLFGHQMRWDLAEGFPLVTTKQVFIRPMVEELLWMLSGSTNNSDLRRKGVNIWNGWADPLTGDLGPIYGQQWRNWPDRDNGTVDQISGVVHSLKTNPDSRRHVVSAWNVADIPDMALAPCHCLFQFYVADGKLSCQLYQRSADMFLGVPFNIASYALLTHMVAQQCDLGVGEFIWTGGDCHIYSNHIDQVQIQLRRQPFASPQIYIKRKPADIFSYQREDFEFLDYQHHPAIHAPVAI